MMQEPLTETEVDILTDRMTKTYHTLRKWMGILAFCFPVFFLLWTWFRCRRLTPGPSISGYYHSHDDFVRDIFVAVLCIEGVCLALYRGYSVWEDWLFNFAGVCAVGIALFPTDVNQAPCPHRASGASSAAGVSAETSQPQETVEQKQDVPQAAPAPSPSHPIEPSGKYSIHGFFAVAFFGLIAIAIIFQARESLPEMKDPVRSKAYARLYYCYAGAMIVVPLIAWAILSLSGASYLVFGVEFVAIWIFAFYWRTKSQEFQETPGQPELKLMNKRWSAATKSNMPTS